VEKGGRERCDVRKYQSAIADFKDGRGGTNQGMQATIPSLKSQENSLFFGAYRKKCSLATTSVLGQ
jgi:hypothetical protein